MLLFFLLLLSPCYTSYMKKKNGRRNKNPNAFMPIKQRLQPLPACLSLGLEISATWKPFHFRKSKLVCHFYPTNKGRWNPKLVNCKTTKPCQRRCPAFLFFSDLDGNQPKFFASIIIHSVTPPLVTCLLCLYPRDFASNQEISSSFFTIKTYTLNRCL